MVANKTNNISSILILSCTFPSIVIRINTALICLFIVILCNFCDNILLVAYTILLQYYSTAENMLCYS